ncbi:MAG TPA: ATP-binding protein [Pirellulales bacterium]|jgi:heavy metal sensor kinase|nr:ATP-binding protein [Pirellulales bacterium]
MPYAKLRELFGTLHFRLTVWYTVVMLLMVVATLAAVREGLQIAFIHELDTLLSEDAREVELSVEEYPGFDRLVHELERKASTHSHLGLFIRLLDARGTLVWQSASAPDDIPDNLAGHHPYNPRTVGNYRVTRRDTDRKDRPRTTVVVGASLAPVQSDVAAITNILLGIGGAVLLIAPLGGYWLAGRATRPLARIIDITARLHPTNLDERLQIRGTRDELDRLCVTINGFLDRIAAYLEQNRQFTADAAHELRSPLAAMQSSLDVALNADRTPAEYKEILGETLEECAALRDLVNQLLLLAENDSGHFDAGSETVQLERLVLRSCDMFSAVAETRGIVLSCQVHDSPMVRGDTGRLRQVVTNLIDNALKFTSLGGRVLVDLRVDSPTQEAVLRVTDSGSGISAADLPHLFKRFYRADKSRQRIDKTGGSGLGLSICESIVRSHRGTITAESELGRGTTITVRLPLVAAPFASTATSNSLLEHPLVAQPNGVGASNARD